MKNSTMFRLGMFTFVFLAAGIAQGQTILYVDQTASAPADGSSWCNAYRYLQDALAVAGPSTEIWVAQGTYRPDQGAGQTPGDTSATFQLANGVVLRGGYAGCRIYNPDVRDIVLLETILSGDLNGDDQFPTCTVNGDCNSSPGGPPDGLCLNGHCIIPDNNDENSAVVVTGSGTGHTAILDGFTITGAHVAGMSNDGGSPQVIDCVFEHNSQSGIRNVNGSAPTLTNCTLRGNGRHGGMINTNSSPQLTDCVFEANLAEYDGYGGGMWNTDSNPILVNCLFRRNLAPVVAEGGGMANWNSNPTLIHCAFIGNISGYGGGGMYNWASSPELVGCLFDGNSSVGFESSHAADGGGMWNGNGSAPTLVNSTFVGNSAALDGGGVYVSDGSGPTLSNSILWNNTDGGEPDESSQVNGGAPVVEYSVIQGWTGALGGAGNNGADPLFVDADGPDDVAGTGDDDLRLQSDSPCIDTADNGALPTDALDLDDDGDTGESMPYDLDGYARIVDGDLDGTATVDRGAYEYRSPIYVDHDATGANDGSSWCDAYLYLQDGLAAATSSGGTINEIRVAQGTYKPDQGAGQVPGDREATFELSSRVSVRGGFAGCGATDPDERDTTPFVTTLSGDLSGDDGPDFANYDENGYHVLSAIDTDDTAILDGVTVTGGNANGGGLGNVGGGMTISEGSPKLIGCSFIRNQSGGSGGGIAATGFPSLDDCAFIENRVGGEYSLSGGGFAGEGELTGCIFVSNTSNWAGGGFSGGGTLADCVFVDNHAGFEGGGAENGGWSALYIGNVFAGNTAGYWGGGFNNHDKDPTLINSVFVGNSAIDSGGGAASTDDTPDMHVVNCTFADNHTDGRGAGLLRGAGELDVHGSVLWGNRDSVGQDEDAQLFPFYGHPNEAAVHYSDVQGWTGVFGGVGNHGAPPLFVGGPSGAWTAAAVTGDDPGQTKLVDESANFVAGELAGKFLNPDTSQPLQTLIVDNSTTEITVWGDFRSLGNPGATYKINDYHLLPGSPCIDAADNDAMSADSPDLDSDGDTDEAIPLDADNKPRFNDDVCTEDGGNGDPPIIDMGAYEFLVDPADVAIGNRVWADLNGDGIQGATEPGLPAALVYLYDGLGILRDFDFADPNGGYSFSDVSWSADYFVRFIPAPGYRLTGPDQGGDDGQDSDADPDTGFTPMFRLCGSGNASRWDAGMVPQLPCFAPDEPIYLYAMTLDANDHPVLHFMDPNQPTQVTGYNVYRSANASLPKQQWTKVASDVIDMDEGTPNKQWIDSSGQEPPPPSNVWFYQVTAYNGPPCDAEGPFGWPVEIDCDDGLDGDLDTLVDCADPDCASACDPLPIELGDTWRYFKGVQEPTPYHPAVAQWAQPEFNDHTWVEGASGFGYGSDCAPLHGTVLNDMQHSYVSVYVRIPFRVEDPTFLDTLTLTVDYDDGWVAYLNGQEVARSAGMGGTLGVPPTFDQTTATGDHECSGSPGGANPPEDFDLGAAIGLLVPGTNVLAIQGHNRGLVSSDFSLIPTLRSTEMP